jgi:small subunit ribosomal protein S4
MLKGERCFSAKCALEKKKEAPGRQPLSRRRRKVSAWGERLKEKQKVRFSYGVMEKQFRGTFARAARAPGDTGDNLFILLERRLDNVTYRLGFAGSRAQARQIVRHGHIWLNGRKTDIPSCLVKEGDVVEWKERSQKTGCYDTAVEEVKGKSVPVWLSLDAEKMKGKMLRLPEAEEVVAGFDGRAIVEFYSR